MASPKPSKRFTPTRWTARLVPALLILLALALIVTILVVVLAIVGVTPGV